MMDRSELALLSRMQADLVKQQFDIETLTGTLDYLHGLLASGMPDATARAREIIRVTLEQTGQAHV
jgi:hypothetical protein